MMQLDFNSKINKIHSLNISPMLGFVSDQTSSTPLWMMGVGFGLTIVGTYFYKNYFSKNDTEKKIDTLNNDNKDYYNTIEKKIDTLNNDNKDYYSTVEKQLDLIVDQINDKCINVAEITTEHFDKRLTTTDELLAKALKNDISIINNFSKQQSKIVNFSKEIKASLQHLQEVTNSKIQAVEQIFNANRGNLNAETNNLIIEKLNFLQQSTAELSTKLDLKFTEIQSHVTDMSQLSNLNNFANSSFQNATEVNNKLFTDSTNITPGTGWENELSEGSYIITKSNETTFNLEPMTIEYIYQFNQFLNTNPVLAGVTSIATGVTLGYGIFKAWKAYKNTLNSTSKN